MAGEGGCIAELFVAEGIGKVFERVVGFIDEFGPAAAVAQAPDHGCPVDGAAEGQKVFVGGAVVVGDVGGDDGGTEGGEGGVLIQALHVGMAGIPADADEGAFQLAQEGLELGRDGAEAAEGGARRRVADIFYGYRHAGGLGGGQKAREPFAVAFEHLAQVGLVEGARGGLRFEDDAAGAEDAGGLEGAVGEVGEPAGAVGLFKFVEYGAVGLDEIDSDLLGAAGDGFNPVAPAVGCEWGVGEAPVAEVHVCDLEAGGFDALEGGDGRGWIGREQQVEGSADAQGDHLRAEVRRREWEHGCGAGSARRGGLCCLRRRRWQGCGGG